MERSFRQNRAAFRCSSRIGRLVYHHDCIRRWRDGGGRRQRQWNSLSSTFLISLLVCILLFPGCASQKTDFSTLYDRCSQDFEHGDLDVAAREAEEGLHHSDKNDRVWNYKFRILLANIYSWKGGKANDAEALLKAVPPPELSTGEFAARRKAIQGTLLTRQKRFEDAHASLREAEILASSTAPTVQSEIFLNEGTLATYEGNFVAAEHYLLAALNAARAHHQRFLEIQITGNLGWMEGQQEHYGAAINWLRKSLEVTESIGASQVEAATLLNLAWLNSEIGDFEAALPALNKAQNLTQNSGIKEMIQNNIGEIYRSQEKYAQASDAFSKAREFATSNRANTDELITSLSGLAWVALAQGQISATKLLETEAQKLVSHSTNLNPRVATDLQLLHADILRASGHPDQSKEVLFALLKKKLLPSDRWQADSELATVYVDTHQNAFAEKQFEKVLRTLDSARASLTDVAQRLAFSSRESLF
ncbi:MAG TPA: tetratricopeptide repeat protein, partial [Verrucomicrobiae bacterium]|nr:tetratricopeptide repeat protein [Verrucomicrobiae bacterium]